MDKYTLQPNESIVMKNENVSHGNTNGELTLTNINLLYIRTKGVFKTRYIIQRYPINQIKVFNEKAQAILGEDGNMDIYFINGQETFKFLNNETFFSDKKAKKEAVRWVNAINELRTGQVPEFDMSATTALPGTEFIAGTIKGTLDIFKGTLGIRPKTEGAKPYGKIAVKCTSCGAPISGIKGQVVRCQYCDSDQQL